METEHAGQERNQPGGTTILIVEDDEQLGQFLVQAIQQETAYQVVLVLDGLLALQLLRHLKPTLLILDYDLPSLNGIKLYDTIHTVRALESIPVLMLTGHAPHIRHDVKERRLPMLSKPFDLPILLKEIELLLR